MRTSQVLPKECRDEIRSQKERVQMDLTIDNPAIDAAYFKGWIDALDWTNGEGDFEE